MKRLKYGGIITPKNILLFASIIVATIVPYFIASQTYLIHILTLVLLFAAFSQTWNLLAGYAGQPSLGHAAFFGTGAYTTGILTFYLAFFKENPWPALFIGGIIGATIGLAIGAICFRLRGPYFALATLATAEVIRLLVLNSEFTRGGLGIVIPSPPPVSFFSFTIDFHEKLPYYYILLAIAIVLFSLMYIISKSRYGLMFQAIREDEDAAMALGVNAYRIKLLAMFICSFASGFIGALYALYITYIDPSMDPGGVLSLFTSIDPVLITIIGGAGTIIGPLIGSFIRIGVGEYLRITLGFRAGMDLILFGAIFMIIFFFARKGIWGFVKEKIIK
ncbi:MAG: branched-chain amino acid ABC transporter permease [Candidatus Bathyarchaeia archaeon]